MRIRNAIFALVLALVGCATSRYIPDPSGRAFLPYEGEITVLTEMPTSGYLRVGTATAEGGLIHGDQAMVEALKRQARKVGADTIVLVGKAQFHGDRVLAMQPVKTQQAIFMRRQ